MTPQNVTVLGATGSIGTSTLDVIARHPERFQVFALSAHSQVEALGRLCQRFRPRYAVISEPSRLSELRDALAGTGTEALSGEQGLCEVAASSEVDMVMAAIVGAAGLVPTLSAIEQGKKVLLANKEALVMSGGLFMEAVTRYGATLLPIDSEHNAIFQCLPQSHPVAMGDAGVTRILLTASGGPFRNASREELAQVRPDQACAHPNWSMGRKISVDSATLMNKGLELIEACWLFQTTPEHIEVHVHPESIIHSMVEYRDGSVLAQLGSPDMRTPIANALGWPERIDAGVASLDLFELASFHFEKPDLERFPSLRLAAEAFRAGGTAPAVLNAANEVAVQAFLEERIAFTRIAGVVEETLAHITPVPVDSIEVVMTQDERAREYAAQCIESRPVMQREWEKN
ncbi:1-deoxy-D-xylulose 5-phosphate reductoisomerase [Halospina denitrificans]|uniref:1-deoxy-D-xylulose 5-phosphate reductoisomerase n=1 Tax=Halospina denitrificans TaxID=332522 RepID=A0A4R7JXK0_9GAMM|nr:1-deoxy-D-xylulose-5-phosphate reductoisomerase [Halospina denitrificans]TDT43192.1 1-deoxy-D-xylulose 5-phosphate reductoisomerase [Halospina denitrificans]